MWGGLVRRRGFFFWPHVTPPAANAALAQPGRAAAAVNPSHRRAVGGSLAAPRLDFVEIPRAPPPRQHPPQPSADGAKPSAAPSTALVAEELTGEQKQLRGAPLGVPARGEDALAKAHEVSTGERPHPPPQRQRGKHQTQLIWFFSSYALVEGKILPLCFKRRPAQQRARGTALCLLGEVAAPRAPPGPPHSTRLPKAPAGAAVGS